jgi:hypothetical protein
MRKYKRIMEVIRKDFFINNVEEAEYFLKKRRYHFTKDELRLWFENTLKEQILELGKLQYLYFQKAKAFGEIGEWRLSDSFCRALYELPNDREIKSEDISCFYNAMRKFDEKKKYPDSQKLKQELKNPYYIFEKMKVDINDSTWINKVLGWIGSSSLYKYTNSSEGFEILFGAKRIYRKFKINNEIDHDIFILEAELARTPLAHLSIVGHNLDNYILLRKVAFERVFYHKWYVRFNGSQFNNLWSFLGEYDNICETIKICSLREYQIHNLADMEKNKELFIQETIEGVVYHEIGHKISLFCNSSFDKLHYSRMISSITRCTNYSAKAITEALADWSVEFEGTSGTILFLAKLAESDSCKARRMLLVYMSDYWFLHYENNFMHLYTDIALSLLMPFMDEFIINFKKIKKVNIIIYNFLCENYKDISDSLLKILKEATFNEPDLTQGEEVNYECLKRKFGNKYISNISNETDRMNESERYDSFWETAFSSCSTETSNTIHRELTDFDLVFEEKLLKFLSQWDPLQAECFNY